MMQDDLVLDESKLTSIHHVTMLDKLKIKFAGLSEWWKKQSSGRKIILGLVGAVVVVGTIVVAVLILIIPGSDRISQSENAHLENRNPNGLAVASPEEPRDHVSPLTGEMMTKTEYQKLTQRKPLVIIVENHPDARPQSGLDQADLVYEMLAEGGITRFVAVYLAQSPEVVGPVRSLRKYFLDVMAELDDPLIMHIGGATSTNPEANALGEVQLWGMKSLGVNGGNAWRVSNRFAPHNAYSSTTALWEKAESLGWVTPASIYTWQYKDSSRSIDNVEVDKVQVNWSSWGENAWSVVWEFDNERNEYRRFHLTEPSIDAVTEKQLTAKNVVVVYAPQYLANDGSARIVYDVIGSGDATIFRDGTVINSTWEKSGRTDRFKFTAESGDEVIFNRGVSWVMVVPVGSEIIY